MSLEAESGGRHDGERRPAARAEQLVDKRVAELSHVGARAGAVDHPADVARSAVGQADAQAAARQRLGRRDLPASHDQAARAAQLAQHDGAGRSHSMPNRAPRGRVPRHELGAVGLAQPFPEGAHLEAQAVDAGTPVAGGPGDRGEVAPSVPADVGQVVPPVGDVRDRRQPDLGPMLRGQPPAPRDGMDDAVRPARRIGDRQGDVDRGQPGSDEQDVGRAVPVAPNHVERAGSPGVGDEERRRAQLHGGPRDAGGRKPDRDHHRLGGQLVAVRRLDGDARGRAADADRASAQLANARGALSGVERVAKRLVEVSAELAARRERGRI
jgi:hypothetical protein